MSIVIAAGNSMKLWLASDGRFSGKDKAGNFVIYAEDLPGIRKFSDQIFVGYVGNAAACTGAINRGADYMKMMGAGETADLLAAGCEFAIRTDPGDHMVDVQIVVAGVTSSGAFGIYAVRRMGGVVSEQRARMESPNVCNFAVLSEMEGDTAWADAIMGRGPDVEENIRACILQAAERSDTVNDHISMISLER